MNCLRLSVGSDLDLGLSRDLEAEMRLLEVELCAMENVWRDVRGRLVGSRVT